MTELHEGDSAPDFTLSLDDGRNFTLSKERGRPVVLYFYPRDGTSGCISENQEFSMLSDQFTALGARLVGISPDTLESHTRFRAKYDLQIPLAADPDRLAIESFGLWQMKKLYGRTFMGVIRTSFLIDAEGKIVRIIHAAPVKGHARKVLNALAEHLGQAGP